MKRRRLTRKGRFPRNKTWTRWGWHLLTGSLLILMITSCFWLGQGWENRVESKVLAQVQRPDGVQETYYTAGDEFLTTGLDQLNTYWREIANRSSSLLRGHLDHYLPIELHQLRYHPADEMMAVFAQTFFAAQNPQTGLIPFSYDRPLPGNPENSAEANLRTEDQQPVTLIARAVEFCRWFPDNQALQQNCLNLAERTKQYFDVPDQGLWGWVDVQSGAEPRNSLTLIQDYGEVAKGFAELSQQTANSFFSWVDQKLQFIWQHRMSSELPILQEQFVLTHALQRPQENSSDTDTLYYVRQLYELFERTGNIQYRDWAIAVTNLWVDRAWNPDWGHFVRKLNPDGSQAVDTLYGDGKYNTLYILYHAYQVTGDLRYLERLKLAWNQLLQMGENGLAPERVQRGRMRPDAGLDKQQTIFLDILVKAYQASGDRSLLQSAETLASNILKQGTSMMRLESGQAGHAFLQLALARHPIARLEMTFSSPGQTLQIKNNHTPLLSVTVPTEVAVIYLPEDIYEIKTNHSTFALQVTGQMERSLLSTHSQ